MSVYIKLLVDEDLSPTVAQVLRDEEGVDAVHVRERGLLGEPDHQVLACAYREDRVLVTANVGDFRRLARACELHPGIVLVRDGGLLRDEQVVVIRKAIAAIRAELLAGGDMLNRILSVSQEGTMTFEALPDPLAGR